MKQVYAVVCSFFIALFLVSAAAFAQTSNNGGGTIKPLVNITGSIVTVPSSSAGQTEYDAVVSNALILCMADQGDILVVLPPASISGQMVTVIVVDGTKNVTVQKKFNRQCAHRSRQRRTHGRRRLPTGRGA